MCSIRATCHYTTLCTIPLLWGAANFTCPNFLVTAKHSTEDPSDRIRLLPTTSRIPMTGEIRHRVNAVACASKQSLLRNQIYPSPSSLYMHVCMHTRTQRHVHTSPTWWYRGIEWSAVLDLQSRNSSLLGLGSSEQKLKPPGIGFTRPWSRDTIYEPFDVKCYVTIKWCALHMFTPQKNMRMVSILKSLCAFCSFHFQFALLFLRVHWGLLHLSSWLLPLSFYCSLFSLVI